MTAEKVKEALKREEKYFLEMQRAAEQQLTILKVHVQKGCVGGVSMDPFCSIRNGQMNE